jgi:hypothetical protein
MGVCKARLLNLHAHTIGFMNQFIIFKNPLLKYFFPIIIISLSTCKSQTKINYRGQTTLDLYDFDNFFPTFSSQRFY